MKTAYAFMGIILLFSILTTSGAYASDEINDVIIYSEKKGSIIRLYAKENETSYLYSHITIKLISSSNNSTAIIYFNDIQKDTLEFRYTAERNYTVNQTVEYITVILNNRAYNYTVRILNDNINIDSLIFSESKKYIYTEQDIIRIKNEMLIRTTTGFLLGFVVMAIYLIRRLKNEIQPVL